MAKPPKQTPPKEDPNIAGFEAVLARKQAARTASNLAKPQSDLRKAQKPRAKQQLRRRP